MGLLLDVRHAAAGVDGVCHGPVDGRCPLLEHGTCDAFEAADGVVFALDLDVEVNRAVLARYRAVRPDMPIYVITSPETAARWAPALTEVTVVTKESEIAELLARVDQA